MTGCSSSVRQIRLGGKRTLKQMTKANGVFHLGDWGVDDALVSVLLPQTSAHLHTRTQSKFFEIAVPAMRERGTSAVHFLQTLYAPSY